MNKNQLQPGLQLFHQFLGQCEFTEACQKLEEMNPDPSSTFIQDDEGEIKEVTIKLLIPLNERKEWEKNQKEKRERGKRI